MLEQLDISLECLHLNINKDSNNWFINININWLSVIKYQMAKNMKLTKKSGLKINIIILKRIKEYPKVTHHWEKMTVNEEWYIILRKLEVEEIIYQNHIKHSLI